jgi:protein involved in polysaccharide export with SLBB domain
MKIHWTKKSFAKIQLISRDIVIYTLSIRFSYFRTSLFQFISKMIKSDVFVRHTLGLMVLFCVFQTTTVFSQSPLIRLPKPQFSTGGYDTLGQKIATTIAQESSGLLDVEINPDEYFVGPNDVFSVSLVNAQPINYNIIVAPDGQLVVPGIGSIKTTGKTLTEVYSAVSSEIKKIYKVQEVLISLSKIKQFKVSVIGSVVKPGLITSSSVDRVSEVLDKIGGVLSNASLRRITITRSDGTILKADLQRFAAFGDRKDNPTVHSGDVISVPFSDQSNVISIVGDVLNPGEYEYLKGDNLGLILSFAQGTRLTAQADSIEIARYDERGLQKQSIFVSSNNSQSQLFELKAGDNLYVRNQSGKYELKEVAIDGGVLYPGRYTINRAESRVADIIKRAGGLRSDALLSSGLLFRRKDAKYYDRELERLRKLTPEQMTEREKRYYQVKSTENIGLVSMDFSKVMSAGTSQDNPILIDKDSIYIPYSVDYVNVIGRVNQPGRVPYIKSSTLNDYVRSAGGFGFRADPDYVMIQISTGEQYLASEYTKPILPGDVIIVPESKDVKFYDVFKEAVTITAQLATVVGVVLGVVFALRRTN